VAFLTRLRTTRYNPSLGWNDRMEWSAILKFLGILVAGILGVLGTVTETRNKDTHRLTRWGKWALWLTITGLFVALGAQMFDTLRERRVDQESREQTNTLLGKLEQQGNQSKVILTNLGEESELQNQTLDAVERVVTPISGLLKVSAIYEVPSNDTLPGDNTSVADFESYLDRYLADPSSKFGSGHSIGYIDVDWLRNIKTQPNAEPPKLVGITYDLFLKERPENGRFNRLFESFKNPTLDITITKETLIPQGKLGKNTLLFSGETQPLLTPSSDGGTDASVFIYYALPMKRLFVEWQFTILKLKLPNGFLSLHDVAKSYCYFQNHWMGTPDPMTPLVTDLQFDRYFSISLDKFQITPDFQTEMAQIPSEPDIIAGRASRYSFIRPYPLMSRVYPSP